jgi:hypothetical protein
LTDGIDPGTYLVVEFMYTLVVIFMAKSCFLANVNGFIEWIEDLYWKAIIKFNEYLKSK